MDNYNRPPIAEQWGPSQPTYYYPQPPQVQPTYYYPQPQVQQSPLYPLQVPAKKSKGTAIAAFICQTCTIFCFILMGVAVGTKSYSLFLISLIAMLLLQVTVWILLILVLTQR